MYGYVLCRKYFRIRPDRSLQWTLIEQSLDETGWACIYNTVETCVWELCVEAWEVSVVGKVLYISTVAIQ